MPSTVSSAYQVINYYLLHELTENKNPSVTPHYPQNPNSLAKLLSSISPQTIILLHFFTLKEIIEV